jgi:CHAD domain-containing protein
LVQARAAALLKRVEFEVSRVTRDGNPDSVHDLRTASRRLIECLQVFEPLFRSGSAKKVHKRLKKLMKSSGELRNLDILVDLMHKAGLRATPIAVGIAGQRLEAKRSLQAQARKWSRRRTIRKCSVKLGICRAR